MTIENFYRESLERLFEQNSTAEITNSSAAHAAIVYEEFFRHSQDYVHIFCECLKKDVFDNDKVLTEAKNAIDRGVEVKCLVQGSPEASEFKKLFDSGNPKKNPKTVIKTEIEGNKPFNFIVMDNKAIRFESEKDKISARVYVNNPEIAKILEKCFKKLSAK